MPKRARHAEVPLGDLKLLATFQCELSEGRLDRDCFHQRSDRKWCNSCWVVRWARIQLRNHKERSKLKTEEGHEAG